MTASTSFDNAAAPAGDRPLDARVRRTRDALLEALFLEMTDRGYERTTVQHLLARAGVGRATFYAHFDGKEALLAASLQRLQGMLEHAERTGSGRLAFTAAFFEHLDSHRRLYRTLVLRESEVTVEARIREMTAAVTSLRTAISEFRKRHGRYPRALNELGSIPRDPVTGSNTTWQTEVEESVSADDFTAKSARPEKFVVNVRSGAKGRDAHGKAWADY